MGSGTLPQRTEQEVLTGIVVALPEELSTLTNRKIDKGNSSLISENMLVAYSGTGPDNAKNAAEQLISKGSKQLVSWGCAAALDASLKPGDLALPKTLLTESQQKLPIEPKWHQHAVRTLSPHFKLLTGCLMESRHIVSSGRKKAVLHHATRCQTVDMESAAIAKVAEHAKIPFLAIRAIADPADMSLPEAITHALNEEGEIEMKKLLGFLATHPYELGGLIKLGFHFNSARTKLKSVAGHLDIIVDFAEKQLHSNSA